MANSIVIELKADDKGSLEIKRFAKNLDDLDKTTHRAGGGVKRLADSMFSLRGAFAGLAGYLTGSAILGGIRSTVSAFMEEERAINALAAAMANAGRLSKGSLASLIEFSATLQRTTTVADDVSLKMMAMLQTFRMSDEQIKRTMKVMADMKVYGYNLESTAMLLGKAFAGNTSALSRYGIIVDESIPKAKRFEAVMQQLEQRFGGAAQAEIDTYGGKLEQLKNRFGDVAESIGHGLLTALDFIIFQIKTIPAWLTKLEIALTKFDIKVRETMGSVFGSESYASSLAASKQYLKELESQLVKNEEAGIRAFNAIGGAEPGSGMKNQAGGAFAFPEDTGEKNKIKQQQEQYRDLLRSVFADRRELVAATQHASEIAKINNKYDELINKVSGLEKVGAAQKQVAITAIEHNREIEKQNLLLREQQDIYADMLKTWQKVADLETDALQRLVDANVPITDDIMERIKTYSQNAPELIEPYLESKGAGSDKGSQGIASLGKLFGVSAGPIMGKEFWTSFKKEWSEGGVMGKLGALGNLAGNMMGLFEMGKNAPSQGYAVAGGALSGALSGASFGATMAAAPGGLSAAAGGLIGGGIGLAVGAGIAAWGAAEEKKKAAEERRAQRQQEADKYSAEFKGLAEEGFYPTFGTKISGGMWQSSKEEMDRYLGIMKNLSKQLSEAIANAFSSAISSPTLQSAMENFSETFGKGMANVWVTQTSEMSTRLMKQMFAPAFQAIDELTYYFEQKWSEVTTSSKDKIVDMFNAPLSSAKNQVDQLQAFVGNITAFIGDAVGMIFPKLGAAVTGMLDMLIGNKLLAWLAKLIAQLGTVFAETTAAWQKVKEKDMQMITEWVWKMARSIEKIYNIEPEWIKEMARSGVYMTQDMGKDAVEQMQEAWKKITTIIKDSLTEAFSAYTMSAGWYQFEQSIKSGVYKWIVEGIASAMVASGLMLSNMGSLLVDFVKVFAQALKGSLDLNKFGKLMEKVAVTLNQTMLALKPVFEKVFGILDVNRSAIFGTAGSGYGGPSKWTPLQLTAAGGTEENGIWNALSPIGELLKSLVNFFESFKNTGAIKEFADSLERLKGAWSFPVITLIEKFFNFMAENWTFPVINTVLGFFTRLAEAWSFPMFNLVKRFLEKLAEKWEFPMFTLVTRFLEKLGFDWKFDVIKTIGDFLDTLAKGWTFPVMTTIVDFFNWFAQEWDFPVIDKIKGFFEWLKGLSFTNLPGGSSGGSSGRGGSSGKDKSIYDEYGVPWGLLDGYQFGTNYVPRTGPYVLHQGEAVIPANQNKAGGRGITINVNFNGSISSSLDLDRAIREIGREVEMALDGVL